LSILFTNPNFLILDEPTNDLDLPTLEVLEQFLLQYQGCILVVSHDRYFMDKLVDHLFVFEGNGIVSDFPGNYSEYRVLSHKNENTSKDERVKPVVQEKSEVQKVRMSYKEKREFESLEKEIEQLTDEKNNLTQKLMQNLPYDEIQSISNRISELEVSIPEKEMRWLELSELEL
jgi:ATP-binding cassette subfamily F protein uup